MFQTIKNAIVSLYSWNIYLLVWIYYRFSPLFCARHGLKFNHLDLSYYVISIEITFKILSEAPPEQENIIMWMKQHAQTLFERSTFAAYFHWNSVVMGQTRSEKMEGSEKSCYAKKSNESISKMTFMKMPLSGCWSNCVCMQSARPRFSHEDWRNTRCWITKVLHFYLLFLLCKWTRTAESREKKHCGCRESWNLK